MVESILKILEAALGIWQSKEKTKYIDEMRSLKTRYYEELKKDPAIRNSAVLDDCRIRLCILTDSIASAITGSSA